MKNSTIDLERNKNSRKVKNGTTFTVGATAYNEEKNIGNFIDSVLNQSLGNKYILKELVIVASGCTDRTVEIINDYRKKDKRIKIIKQEKREGKAVAVNLFLKRAKTRLLILESTDTIPSKTCYRLLLNKLTNEDIGLTAGKIVPKDNSNTFWGFANHLKWELHHKINLQFPHRPKVGELIAFKKIFERIPPETAVDEASIEPLIHLQGFQISYVPSAIIYNKGPENLREYLSGRRRIYAGHYITKKKYAYEIITFSNIRVVSIFISNMQLDPSYIVKAIAVVFLEIFARLIGYLDIKLKRRDHSIWKIASTSKDLN